MAQEQKPPRPVWTRHPTARYVVSVDNQAKSSFDTREAADSEARRISEGFPKLAVKVSDSQIDSATALGPPEAADEKQDC